MLNRLKNLVFGLEEFDKTKIEIRFDIVRGMISSIVIKELADFEILEEIIYKIKEELRVRSSNINKTIRNPSRNFRKKDVLVLLENLVKIKYAFLERAFNLIGDNGGFKLEDEVSSSMGDILDDNSIEGDSDVGNNNVGVENLTNNLSEPVENLDSQFSNSKTSSGSDSKTGSDSDSNISPKVVEKVEGEKIYEPKVKKEKSELSDLLSSGAETEVKNLKNDNHRDEIESLTLLNGPGFEVKLENGKVPFILISFDGDEFVDCSLIKNLASAFFEVYGLHGTNIIQDEFRFMILPRFQNDGLFELPRKDVNIDEIFDKIISKQKELNKGKKLSGSLDDKVENEVVLPETEAEGGVGVEVEAEGGVDGKEIAVVGDEEIAQSKQIDENKKIAEKKQAELDKKFDEFNKKKELLRREMEDGFLKVSEDSRPKIRESLKSKEDSLDALLSTIDKTKKDMKQNPNPKKDSSDVKMEMDDAIEFERKTPEIKKEPDIEVEKKTDDDKVLEKNDFEIYRDDKIFVYLNAYSSVMGEVIVEPISGASMAYLDVADISYISIFSKIFSTIVYELLGAHGTNVIWDFDSSKLRIVPRFTEDKISNLKWELKSNTDEFLEQVRAKLLSEMQKEIKEDRSEDFKKANDAKIAREKPPETELEVKGKYVLDALRKIP